MARLLRPLLIVLLLSCLLPVSASAASRMRCQLEPVPDSESWTTNPPEEDYSRFTAMWMATASCPGSPLDGQIADIRQMARLNLKGDMIGGPTRMVIDFTGAGVHVQFDGQTRGFFDADLWGLSVRASSAGGAKLMGEETLMLADDGEVEDFMPGAFEFIGKGGSTA